MTGIERIIVDAAQLRRRDGDLLVIARTRILEDSLQMVLLRRHTVSSVSIRSVETR